MRLFKKFKFSATEYHASRNHQGEVVIVAEGLCTKVSTDDKVSNLYLRTFEYFNLLKF